MKSWLKLPLLIAFAAPLWLAQPAIVQAGKDGGQQQTQQTTDQTTTDSTDQNAKTKNKKGDKAGGGKGDSQPNPQPAPAASSTSFAGDYRTSGANCKKGFFFLSSIYEYLDSFDSDCGPDISFPDDLLKIGLAIIDDFTRLAGFIAVISIFAGGINYMTAGGDFQKTANAKRRLYNSLIGLAIVSIAAALIAFLGHTFG